MSKYNLLDEKWLLVITDELGTVKEVSLLELFKNAHHFKGLAGETVTQNFVILRYLLAVLHTVYSRFSHEGVKYNHIELDEFYRQSEEVDEDDYEDHIISLNQTWEALWNNKQFTSIIEEYLERWRSSFFLFDEEKPFAQITQQALDDRELSKAKPSSVSAKNINRRISESGNKIALFSPKYDSDQNKEIMMEEEIVRWLLTFHGYVGLSDKVIFGKEKYKASKGWLFDIGGVFLEGDSLFETLILNLVLIHPEEDYRYTSQKPIWEKGIDKSLDDLLIQQPIDNLAELYTHWSRAIYIDPHTDVFVPFEFSIVKLPEIEHQNNFLELMTFWRDNPTGINKDTLTPRKHSNEQAVWRSFGLLSLPNSSHHHKPGIVDWIYELDNLNLDLELKFRFISMQDDGNATSWVPTDEIYDSLDISEYVLTDVQDNGWVVRINDEVEKTKKIIDKILKGLASDINEIRNASHFGFVNKVVREAYFEIDQPFRNWLSSITVNDSMETKVAEWRSILRKKILDQANELLKNANNRDFIGIKKGERILNIATAYNRFIFRLNQELPKGETDGSEKEGKD